MPDSHSLSDHSACQASVQAIYDAAVEVMDDKTGLTDLMPARAAFEYRLGTAGHLYHREGITDLIRERDEAREALRRIENPATGVMRSAAEVAVNATIEARGLRGEIEGLRSALDGIKATAARAHELGCDPTIYSDIVTLAEMALGTDEKGETA